jgi:acetyltransferase-like isoleucine patch superfamily enzyme
MLKYLKTVRNIYLTHIKWRRFDIGAGFHAGRGVVLWAKDFLTIGRNCYIGRYSQIECNTRIGDNVIIANNVAFVGRYDHHYQLVGTPTRLAPEIRDTNYDWKGRGLSVDVGDDVWIGYGSIVLSGVSIGKCSIVAAGSVVTKNVEPFTIVGGNPARLIGRRFSSREEERRHWELYQSSK